jgi:hypothetical protein
MAQAIGDHRRHDGTRQQRQREGEIELKEY